MIAVERELCRRSFGEFVRRAWHVLEPGAELKWGMPVEAICLHLEAVSRGEITRLLINVPPGTMKSLLVSVFWPAWEWGPCGRADLRIVGTAHEETLAIRDSRKCRDLIKSQWYQEKWPIQLLSDLDGKMEFGNKQQGVRQARAFKSMTGVRGDRVILDDPISAANANSAAILESSRITFLETLPTRVNNEKSSIVVIMQRLHEQDVSGVILEKGLPYVHLCIPMRFESDRRCTTSIGWTDPRTEEGELMFPERFSEEDVKTLEQTLGSYGTAGQLQQRPSPRGGGILKTEWFKYWTSLPRLEFRFITADTAQKTAEKNDYSVFQCWGRSLTGTAVLIDQIRGKWEAPDLIVQARAFWNKHLHSTKQDVNGTLRGMYVEDKVSGTGLIQTLRREGIPVLPVFRNYGLGKASRCYDAAPFIESGNVLLPQDAPWLQDFLSEASVFPSGVHDDQLDPMFDAVSIVQKAPAIRAKNVIPLPVRSSW